MNQRRRPRNMISWYHRRCDGSTSLDSCFDFASTRFFTLGIILVIHATILHGDLHVVNASASSSSYGMSRTTPDHHSVIVSPKSTHVRLRTRLTGYGSRASYKSIFHSKNLNKFHNGRRPPSNLSATLWVQRRVVEKGSSNKQQSQLWFRSVDANNQHTSLLADTHNASAAPLCFSVMSLPNHDRLDDLNDSSESSNHGHDCQIQTCEDDHELPTHQWIPIEGIYGVYLLPSGLLWVLITETEPVYKLSPMLSSSTDDCQQRQPLLNIRRIQSMELFHQASTQYSRSTTTAFSQQQQKEEARQLQLLRHALKEHDFYYVPQEAGSAIVPDMTRTLQRSFDMYELQQETMNETNTSSPTMQRPMEWWNITDKVTADNAHFYPDTRFFWNEFAMYSLLHAFQRLASLSSIDANNSTGSTTTLTSKTYLEILLDHVIPVTSAFCGVHRNLSAASPSNWTFDQILISRRSRFRAGTRFAKRGADALGHVANYAETEQICVVHPDVHHNDTTSTPLEVYSHVQVRGSIPLRWSSPTDITTYRPRVRIGTDPLAQARAMWAHVVEQFQHYVIPAQNSTDSSDSDVTKVPQLVFCNLIDKKSDQGRLGRAFDAVLQAVLDTYRDFQVSWSKGSSDIGKNVASLRDMTASIAANVTASQIPPDSPGVTPIPFLTPQTVQHLWFDFHAEVKGGKWDKLGGLLKQLSPTLLRQGFLAARLDGRQWTITQRQSGVIRTNCMDCLDRTNVVQSIIGRFILFRQLSKRSALSSTTTMKSTQPWNRQNFPSEYKSAFRRDSMKLPWASGEVAHRLLWADNADVISRLYAGTAALKGDFTRTGMRTKRGALDDGMNSLQRYYLNNFLDADRQEGIDLMVGQAQFTSRLDLLENDSNLMVDTRGSAPTLKEAVRVMMLGTNAIDDSASDDKFHIRIKPSQGGSIQNKNRGPRTRPLIETIRQPLLELRWLPGDLQHQMRSRTTSLHQSPTSITGGCFPRAALRLEAMEQRLTTEIPWWVGVDSDTDEENDTNDSSTDDSGGFTLQTGYVVGALVAAIQAPLTTATMTVALLGFLLKERSKPKKSD